MWGGYLFLVLFWFKGREFIFLSRFNEFKLGVFRSSSYDGLRIRGFF